MHLAELGRRIAVVGGGGKSTLARALAEALGVPHVELDAQFWGPGWVESEADEFRERIEQTLRDADPGWVCDGNYLTKLGDLVLGQADTVILVNMPWHVMYRRVVLRGIARAADGRAICGGNRQSWRGLVGRDSLLWWHVVHRAKYRRRPGQVRELTSADTRWLQVDTPRALDALYRELGLRPQGGRP